MKYDINISNIPKLDLVYDAVYIEGHIDSMKKEVRNSLDCQSKGTRIKQRFSG